MDSNLMRFQSALKRSQAFFEQHPEWKAVAAKVVNDWGNGVMLNHAIALALEEAWHNGRHGIRPEAEEAEPEHADTVRRVSRRQPAQVAPTIQRRSRR